MRYTFYTYGQLARLRRVARVARCMLARGHSVLIFGNNGEGKAIAALEAANAFRPLRAPHHTCSHLAIAKEACLASGGVLYLDACDEYDPWKLRVALGRPSRIAGGAAVIGTATHATYVAGAFDVVFHLVEHPEPRP